MGGSGGHGDRGMAGHPSGSAPGSGAPLAGTRLDDATVGRKVALQYRERPFGVDRVFDGADDIVIMDLGTGDIFAKRSPGDRHAIEVQLISDPAHQARQSASVIKILHQIFVAARPHIGDDRHLAAGFFEIVEPDVAFGAARLGDQMNDRVRRTTHRHGNRDRVLESLAGLNFSRVQIFPHHLDDAAAAFGSHADVT